MNEMDILYFTASTVFSRIYYFTTSTVYSSIPAFGFAAGYWYGVVPGGYGWLDILSALSFMDPQISSPAGDKQEL